MLLKPVLVASALLGSCGQDASPIHAMVTVNTIVITNGGATNLIGYRILIAVNGEAAYATGSGSGSAMLPASLHERIVRDIDAAKPLANLPMSATCAKPVSFGTSTFIAVGAERSPDLSCPGNAAAQALKDDVEAIDAFLKVRNVPRSQGHELTPQNF